MRRGLIPLLAGLALAAPAPALGQAPPPVVADGVTVAGVAVGGLTEDEAVAEIQAFFDRRLDLRLRGRAHTPGPRAVGARARVFRAASEALAAPADTEIPLEVVVYKWKLKRWVNGLARRFDRAPRNSTVKLVRGRPWVTKAKQGRKLETWPARLTIARSLRQHVREPVALPARSVKPSVTRRNIGPAVVIHRGSKRLVLYRGMTESGMRVRRVLGVATGMAAYPTPLGSFRIATMQRNPWWYPPNTSWAAGASPVPPGPGNPLGTRWMGLSIGGIGMHGTPDAASIGYSASHGCIRMRIGDAEWLFERVRVGTPVFIVGS